MSTIFRTIASDSEASSVACYTQEQFNEEERTVARQQSARMQARRAALDVQTRVRKEREEQDRRRSALGVAVVTALAERDATIAACEAKAGAALRVLIEDEGLSLREAIEWCGGHEQVALREAGRLRRLGAEQPAQAPIAPRT